MSQETPLSPRDPWVVRSVVAAAAIFVISVVLGFMVFPLMQRNARASSLWDAICSAAGVVARADAARQPIEPEYKVSSAVMTSNMLRGADAEFDRTRRDARPCNARSAMGLRASAAPILPISRVSTPA